MVSQLPKKAHEATRGDRLPLKATSRPNTLLRSLHEKQLHRHKTDVSGSLEDCHAQGDKENRSVFLSLWRPHSFGGSLNPFLCPLLRSNGFFCSHRNNTWLSTVMGCVGARLFLMVTQSRPSRLGCEEISYSDLILMFYVVLSAFSNP